MIEINNQKPIGKKLYGTVNIVQNDQLFGTGVLTGQQEMRNDSWSIILCCCCSCGSGGSSQIDKDAVGSNL
ncbi:hypothetical protein M4D81_06040 [Paenibacillus sp. p3-SID867]|uniref:hypothetical protein n=1 Tax=Paenibacillus sp. p3-SID867 TaxID=2916363 RepID=UPI0021A32DCA|nr:hypothetical protein [Paenibacillus sp. p3-SID867]MCT1398565.1 hypothetical protein [Paenibacillus sp. p3-SID867]